MKIKAFILTFIKQFFVIYTGTMFATIFFCKLNTPPTAMLPVDYLWQAAIFSFFACLPSLALLSGRELSRKQYHLRIVLHTLLLEAVLLPAGHILDMYDGVWGGIAFFFVILVVDAFVWFFMFLSDFKSAEAINKKLKLRRKKEESHE